MNRTVVFNCPVTKYMVEFVINEVSNVAMFSNMSCDYMYMKAWLSLLRSSMDRLSEMGVLKIIQSVSAEEYEDFLKGQTSWVIINSKDGIYDIICPIDDFVLNYGKGIGI